MYFFFFFSSNSLLLDVISQISKSSNVLSFVITLELSIGTTLCVDMIATSVLFSFVYYAESISLLNNLHLLMRINPDLCEVGIFVGE